jgi:hypothetical protein
MRRTVSLKSPQVARAAQPSCVLLMHGACRQACASQPREVRQEIIRTQNAPDEMSRDKFRPIPAAQSSPFLHSVLARAAALPANAALH